MRNEKSELLPLEQFERQLEPNRRVFNMHVTDEVIEVLA
jgi:hypothetical protein